MGGRLEGPNRRTRSRVRSDSNIIYRIVSPHLPRDSLAPPPPSPTTTTTPATKNVPPLPAHTHLAQLEILPSPLARPHPHRFSPSPLIPPHSSAALTQKKTGTDLEGNTYWEHSSPGRRPRRIVAYRDAQLDLVDYKLTRTSPSSPSPPLPLRAVLCCVVLTSSV